MIKTKCYWAGIGLLQFTVRNDEALAEKIRELKESMKGGEITQVSCCCTIAVTEMCIDVYKDGKFIGMHNIKI